MLKKQGIIGIILCLTVGLFCACGNDSLENLADGKYEVETELSCYVPAMGGIEFGGPLLQSSYLTVDGEVKTLTLNLTKSSVTIYSITCFTFVDPTPDTSVGSTRGVENGTIGYYNENGDLLTEGVRYNLSDDTATNSKGNEVNYVDSISIPILFIGDEYKLTLYINSQVMGVQFCENNVEATETTYTAVLSVDWESIEIIN